MSRSNSSSIELKNPSTRWFEWDGSNGGFKYYDSVAKEKGRVAYPFKFMVLDQLVTIKGYCKKDNAFYFSNEIRRAENGVLTVKTDKGVKASGLWNEIKSKITGADFCKSVYIAYFDGADLKIGNIAIMTSSLGTWIEFVAANNVEKVGVVVKSHIEDSKGNVTFKKPVYEAIEISEATNKKAIDLDKRLQEYLKVYFSESDHGKENNFHDEQDLSM